VGASGGRTGGAQWVVALGSRAATSNGKTYRSRPRRARQRELGRTRQCLADRRRRLYTSRRLRFPKATSPIGGAPGGPGNRRRNTIPSIGRATISTPKRARPRAATGRSDGITKYRRTSRGSGRTGTHIISTPSKRRGPQAPDPAGSQRLSLQFDRLNGQFSRPSIVVQADLTKARSQDGQAARLRPAQGSARPMRGDRKILSEPRARVPDRGGGNNFGPAA